MGDQGSETQIQVPCGSTGLMEYIHSRAQKASGNQGTRSLVRTAHTAQRGNVSCSGSRCPMASLLRDGWEPAAC